MIRGKVKAGDIVRIIKTEITGVVIITPGRYVREIIVAFIRYGVFKLRRKSLERWIDQNY